MINYNVVAEKDAGHDFHNIVFTEGKWKDFEIRLGGVAFDEEDPAIMHFDYDLVKYPFTLDESNKNEFEQHLGDLLIQMITESLERGDLVCAGGTEDEEKKD